MRFAFALLVAVGTATAAPVPKELKTPDDKERIVGIWLAKEPDTVRFRFEADGNLQTWHGTPTPGPGAEMKWTWTVVDAKATPRRAKITRAESPAIYYDCIYEWSGDTLKFALVLNNRAAIPDKVEPQGGLEFHILTLDKPAK